MKIQFLQAAHLDGKNYSRGLHEVPEKSLSNRYFHKLVKAGLVYEADAVKIVTPVSLEMRQKELLEKINKRNVKQASAKAAVTSDAASVAPPAAMTASPSSEDVSSDDEEKTEAWEETESGEPDEVEPESESEEEPKSKPKAAKKKKSSRR